MNRTLVNLIFRTLILVIFLIHHTSQGRCEDSTQLRIATFSTDITIPIGHRCMGVLKTKSKQIDDPLEAHGLVLLGSGPAVVLVALDWCEVRNGAYDQWRDALANAANTSRSHVLVCSLHQHDAPVTDSGAQAYLDSVGLEGELYDVDFQGQCIRDTVKAMKAAVEKAEPLTHVGTGQAKVDQVASSRRVVHADGSIRFDRYSRMSADSFQAKADEGEIDPMLKSVTFYSGERPIAVISSYATHPMSDYGQGAVSADFVGMARRRRQLETPGTKQIYVSGCSGDVTAGKYNDGCRKRVRFWPIVFTRQCKNLPSKRPNRRSTNRRFDVRPSSCRSTRARRSHENRCAACCMTRTPPSKIASPLPWGSVRWIASSVANRSICLVWR